MGNTRIGVLGWALDVCVIPSDYFKLATVIKKTIQIPVHTIYKRYEILKLLPNGRSNGLSCVPKIMIIKKILKCLGRLTKQDQR